MAQPRNQSRPVDASRWAVDYSARSRYRPPPGWYRRAQVFAPAVQRAGLGPGYAVVLEVPGRVSGKPRRVALVGLVHDRKRYLVSLAGESEWVRNVRAADGHAVLTVRRRSSRVLLEEVPAGQRAPVLLAYVHRGGPFHRAGRSRAGEARIYFGLGPHPSLGDVQGIVEHYPVFRVRPDAGPHGSERADQVQGTDGVDHAGTPVGPAGDRRPWLAGTGWFGATSQERRRRLPGDDLLAAPLLQITHGVTVQAPAQRIWPWLMQTGQQRAGFYSDSPWWDACVDAYYRLLSREQHRPRVRYEQHDSDRIVPAWQDLRVGEEILDGPPGTAYYVVRQIDPQRSFVLSTDTHLPHLVPARWRGRVRGEVSDTTVLIPIDATSTRVLRRMRAAADPPAFRILAVPVVVIWGEAITARTFLRGLRRRAETTPERSPDDHTKHADSKDAE
jgi:hypothetical protein